MTAKRRSLMDNERTLQLSRRFLNLLNNGGSLNSLCTIVSEELGNPVSIHLPTRTIIAHSTSYTQEYIHSYTRSFPSLESGTMEAMFARFNRDLRKGIPIMDAFPLSPYRQLLMGCLSGDHMVAIIEMPIINAMPTQEDLELMRFIAPVVVTCMQLNGLLSPAKQHHFMQVYLSVLLRGDSMKMYQQMETAGTAIGSTANWALACVVPASASDLEKIRIEVEKFCARREKIWCTQFEERMVILLDFELFGRLEKLSEMLAENGRIIASDPYEVLQDTLQQYQYCITALRLAEFEESRGKIIFVWKYKVLINFLSYVTEHQFSATKFHLTEAIRTYDFQHRTEYFATLRAYLLCNRDPFLTADRLHIHKNTVNYRLQRLNKLFALDLSDTHSIVYLYVSLFGNFYLDNIT